MELTPQNSQSCQLATGKYEAVFVSLTPDETEKGPALKWQFRLPDSGDDVSYYSDQKVTTANKTGRWLSSLIDKPLTTGEPISTDQYIGQKYRLEIGRNRVGKETLVTFTKIK